MCLPGCRHINTVTWSITPGLGKKKHQNDNYPPPPQLPPASPFVLDEEAEHDPLEGPRQAISDP